MSVEEALQLIIKLEDYKFIEEIVSTTPSKLIK